nr:deoxyribose-phosphate aldolase [uncultured Oribacterium sp.]
MDIAKMIDHTMLKADATKDTILRYCEEAKDNGFASVCVNSSYVALVAKALQGSGVHTCSVVGFPLGAMSTKAKAFEAKQAVEDGACEVDMVLHIGALKDKDYLYVKEDIRAVVMASKPALVKVILETCLLNKEEIRIASALSEEAGADFIKTSTGFSTGGATVEDIKIMKESVSPKMKLKASGGIRSREFAEELIAAGANRLGVGNGLLLL